MQAVSQGWKDNQKNTIVGESFVELVYEVGDPDSLADASASDNGAMEFSNTPLIVNEVDETMVRYATFEKDLWKLDGSCRLLSNSAPYSGTGYVSDEICDDEGLFSQNPILTVSFTKVHEKVIPGIIIVWGHVYDDYADSFKVTVYNGETVVNSVTVEGNTQTISKVMEDIVGYDSITIEILKWGNPCRRARVEEIFVGIKKVYGKSDLLSYRHSMNVDLLSAKLPKAEIKFEVSNLEGEYNPFNLESDAKYLIERQRIAVRYGYKINNSIEWIKAGTFYLCEWNTPQNGISASFTARDLLEFMSAKYTENISNTSLYDLAESVLIQASLPSNRDGSLKWVIDESLKNITIIEAELKNDITLAEVLQLVANAGCCVMYQDRKGKLHIEPLSGDLTDYHINAHNSYKNAELELSKKLKSVDVNDGMAVIENDIDGEVQSVKNVLISPDRAVPVGTWIKDTLKNRMLLKGEFRADPRLDPLDKILVSNKYSTNKVIVTEIVYIYNGAFKGRYEGRVIE